MNTEPKKSARDARLRSLLIAAALVIVGGLAVAWWWSKSHTSVANGSPEVRAAHAREKTDVEVEQRFNEGVAMLNDKQYDQALKAFHRVLELSPRMPEAHVNAGFALLGLKRYAVARDFFEGALVLRKTQLNAYYGLAEALEGLNDLPGALGAMRTYVHLSPPDDPYRRKAEAAVMEWGGKLNEAHGKSGAGKPASAVR